MNIMIASDIHGSADCCRRLLDAFEKEKPETFLLLGDLLYHGPRNGLPEQYSTAAVAAMLNSIRHSIMCVRGNCDSSVDQMVLEFPIMAEYCLIYGDGRMIFATHGHTFNKGNMPSLPPGGILLHGHTHIPAWETCDGHLCINPGSVSLPKQGSQRSYMILRDGAVLWKDLSGQIYHEIAL